MLKCPSTCTVSDHLRAYNFLFISKETYSLWLKQIIAVLSWSWGKKLE